MKRCFAAFAVVMILGLAAARPAFSQSIYLGAYGGFSSQTPQFQNIQFSTDTTFVYGVRAGVRLLTFALELTYFQAAHNIVVGGGSLIDWNGKVNDYSYLGANAKLFFPLLFIQPYITAGYGYYTTDIQTIDKARDGGFNFGAGIELKFGSKFGLSAEGRWHNVNVSFQDIAFSVGDFTLCGGFNFYF
jgi:hypothetical protein